MITVNCITFQNSDESGLTIVILLKGVMKRCRLIMSYVAHVHLNKLSKSQRRAVEVSFLSVMESVRITSTDMVFLFSLSTKAVCNSQHLNQLKFFLTDMELQNHIRQCSAALQLMLSSTKLE